MNSKPLKSLTEKYNLVREQVAGAGVMSAGDSTYSPENMVKVVPVAISWKDIGLFEPNDKDETEKTEKAIKEVEALFDKFQKDLDAWQKKHKDLGAVDTVAREQLAQFVAKNLFGLTKLD